MNAVNAPMTPNNIHKMEVNLADFVVKIGDADFRFLYSHFSISRLMIKLINPVAQGGTQFKSGHCLEVVI